MNRMKHILSLTLCIIAFVNVHADNKSLKLALEKSRQKQTPVFIVVTDNTVSKKELKDAYAITDIAKKDIEVLNVFELDKDDVNNTEFIENWKLQEVPLPLIIALSPRGNFIGGIPAGKANAEDLKKLIPSPKLDEIYSASTNHMPVFIVMGSKNDKNKKASIDLCNKAIEEVDGQARLVSIDFEDKAEAELLTYMKVNTKNKTVTTMVINKHGETTEIFKNKMSLEQLVDAATKDIEENCSHGSCGHQH